MSRRYAWGALAAAGLVLELVSLRRHDGATLSETTRALYRTHTTAGRVAFVASWAALSVVLVPHICKAAETAAAAIEEVIR